MDEKPMTEIVTRSLSQDPRRVAMKSAPATVVRHHEEKSKTTVEKVQERIQRANAQPTEAEQATVLLDAARGSSMARPGMSPHVSRTLFDAAKNNPALARSLAISFDQVMARPTIPSIGPPPDLAHAPGTQARRSYNDAIQQESKGADWQKRQEAATIGSGTMIESPYGGKDGLPSGNGVQFRVTPEGETTPPMDGQGNAIMPAPSGVPLEANGADRGGPSMKHVLLGVGIAGVAAGILILAASAKKKGKK